MLSILIPVYRFDVRRLVRELVRQANRSRLTDYEILVYDDGSSDSVRQINQEIAQLEHVRYVELSSNLGRSRIRNYLAEQAIYPYLLYLDSDVFPEQPGFLARYLHELPTTGVLCGGRSYAPIPPQDTKRHLHWHYGSKREVRPAEVRNRQPHFGFMSNNFLTSRELIHRHPFSDLLTGYGHEDTLWAHQLQLAGVDIRHVDNPARHLGLETTGDFVRKQRQAVANLRQAKALYPGIETRLTRTVDRIERFGSAPMSRRILQRIGRRLLRQVYRVPPRLQALDLLKLKWYLE